MMTNQPDTTDTRPQPPKHYLLSLPLALKRIEELEEENARLNEACDVFERNSYGASILLEAIRHIAGRDFRDHHDWQHAFKWCVERAKFALKETGREPQDFVSKYCAELETENAQLRRMVDALALRRREEVQERIEQLQDDTEYTTEED